jgi:predicted alpha/beta-fold hydrolase
MTFEKPKFLHRCCLTKTSAPFFRHNVAIPFCVVHALDDPLVTWRSVAANNGLMHPQNLTSLTGSGNLFLLLTKSGGHVGWPTGWTPNVDTWMWMSDISMSFVAAVTKALSTQ